MNYVQIEEGTIKLNIRRHGINFSCQQIVWRLDPFVQAEYSA